MSFHGSVAEAGVRPLSFRSLQCGDPHVKNSPSDPGAGYSQKFPGCIKSFVRIVRFCLFSFFVFLASFSFISMLGFILVCCPVFAVRRTVAVIFYF